jgi:hypothetical protein
MMGFNLQSSHCMILLVCLLAVSVLGMVGFLNNAYAADNMTVGSKMNMKANVNASTSMTGNMTKTMTGNMTGNMTKTMTGNMNKTTSITNIPKILPPLQQFKSGVAAKSVQCNGGLTLIIKAEDSSPACVTSQIAQTLTARGWGTMP